jgi:hypothetical protein
MYGNISFSQVAFEIETRDFEVSKDQKEWEYVERLLPEKIIPSIPKLKEYHSGFQPPRIVPGKRQHPLNFKRNLSLNLKNFAWFLGQKC